MSKQTITATEASRSFSALLNKVYYRGESYEIRRGSQVIAKIIPATLKSHSVLVSDLQKIFKRFPGMDIDDCEKFAEDLIKIKNSMRSEEHSWD